MRAPVSSWPWKHRLYELLAVLGFARLADYARSYPTATLTQLSHRLGAGDLTPIQLRWALVEEAETMACLEHCARDLLVRSIHEVKDGWPEEHAWGALTPVRLAIEQWEDWLPSRELLVFMRSIGNALLNATNIPPRWKPSGVDDPILAEVFELHWPQHTLPAGVSESA